MNYYLFAAYCAIWFILFAYLYSVKSRQKTLEQAVDSIQQQLQKLK